MEDERWIKIESHPFYMVSNYGRVKSIKRTVRYVDGRIKKYSEVIISQRLDRYGYMRVNLYNNAKRKVVSVHRLVCLAFLGKSNLCVNHKNGNKTDNRLVNLEYVTIKKNNEHAYKLGLMKNGQNHGRSKLLNEEARKIKYEHKDLSYKQISEMYSISEGAVWAIRKEKSWKHI